MVGKDADRAEQLFGEHRPRQHMWPGSAAEAQQQIGIGPLGGVETVRRTDQEPRLAHAIVAPSPQLHRERDGTKHLAGLVQHHALGLRLDGGQLAATIGQLGDPRRPRDPLQIPVDELRLGRSPDPAARDDMKQDQACPTVSMPVLVPGWAAGSLAPGGGGASPNAHIRSRL